MLTFCQFQLQPMFVFNLCLNRSAIGILYRKLQCSPNRKTFTKYCQIGAIDVKRLSVRLKNRSENKYNCNVFLYSYKMIQKRKDERKRKRERQKEKERRNRIHSQTDGCVSNSERIKHKQFTVKVVRYLQHYFNRS